MGLWAVLETTREVTKLFTAVDPRLLTTACKRNRDTSQKLLQKLSFLLDRKLPRVLYVTGSAIHIPFSLSPQSFRIIAVSEKITTEQKSKVSSFDVLKGRPGAILFSRMD